MRVLPTGKVTFLFTDIEGSTQLWEHHPDAMRQALARHDAILRRVIEAHGGHIFKTVGDAFYAAFADAPKALNAALEAQRALRAETWEGTGPLRVRMALHTGLAEERDNDYFGPTLNRVARLLSVGYGGQVLLSLATVELVRSRLPDVVSLRDLGLRRLKDLIRPENIFQVVAPDLPTDFPPIRTLDRYPNNLPVQLTSFVGREKEIAEVSDLLGKTHLLTLTGSGGVGKTRLSLQVAANLLDSFEHGVWLVELAPISDPALVAETMAEVLGVREESARPALDMLVDYLRKRRLLLVLDNCEHLIAVCAEVAQRLLSASPDLRILASSREALGISGEVTWRVPSLACPDAAERLAPEQVASYEAVRLFVERAAVVKSDFAITDENAAAIVQICSQLDGIPLAIELAAARIKMFTAEQIAARLDDRFRLLSGGSRTALPRQQTLRALIDWSYSLLSEPERIVFRRLSVFVDGWTFEAAEFVCTDDELDVLELLAQLVNKSLVAADEHNGEARYHFAESIRQYAREKLQDSGEMQAMRNRHLEFYAKFLAENQSKLHGPLAGATFRRFDTEHGNLRAMLEWAISSGQAEITWRLLWGMGYYWLQRGEWVESIRWLNLASAISVGLKTAYKARALGFLSGILARCGNMAQAMQLREESITMGRELNDTQAIAGWLITEGFATGDMAQGIQMAKEGIALFRKTGEPFEIANALFFLADQLRINGDFEQAAEAYAESLAIFRQIGDSYSIAYQLGNLGRLAYQQGDYDKAQSLMEEAVALARETGNKLGIADWLIQLGRVLLRKGDTETAKPVVDESLSIWSDMANNVGIVDTLLIGAGLAALQGDYDCAARLLGASNGLRNRLDETGDPTSRAEHDHYAALIKQHLGEDAFRAAYAEGERVEIEQAVALARSLTTA